jgi:hypothetical protein
MEEAVARSCARIVSPEEILQITIALLFLWSSRLLMVFMSCKGQLIVARQFSGGIVCATSM